MSKTRIRGITIELNGDASGLSKELKTVNSDLKTTQSALRDVDKLLKLDPGNTELLSQKQKLLNQALTETKQKLDIEKKTLAELAKTDTTGAHQAEQDALQREIVETEEKVKSLQKEIKNFGSVGVQQVKAFGEKLQEVGNKITTVGQNMTMKFTVPILAAFGVAANAASDYEENLNKMSVAFGQYADKVRDFTDNALDSFGLSKVEASEAASAFGALAKGVGLSEASAADMSITLTALTSDLSSYFNQSTDVSAKALEAIFTGESEALKKFGVVMTQTNLEDFAAAHGKVYSAASEAEKVMIRYNYVLEKTRDAQGDYSRSSDGFANTFRTFKSALQDLALEIGQQLLPIITPLIKKLTEWVKKFGQLPDGVKKAIVYFGLFVAAIGPILTGIGSLVSGIGGLLTVLPALGGALGAGGLATAAGAGAAGLAGVAGSLGTIALVAVGTIAAIAAISAGMKALAEHWPEIEAGAKQTAKSIKDNLDKAAEHVRNSKLGQDISHIASSMKTAFDNAGGGIKGAISAAFAGAKTAANDRAAEIQTKYNDAFNRISQTVNTATNNMRASLTNGFNAVRTTISSTATSIRSSMTTAFDAALTSANSAKQGISNGWSSLKTTAGTIFSTGYDSIKTKIQTVFDTINDNASVSKTNFSNMLAGMKSSADTDLKSITDYVSSAYNKAKTTLSTALKMSFTSDFKTPSILVNGKFDVDRNGNITTKPTLSLKWNKSAMQFGAILDGATIFGMMGNTLLGGGEAGKEAIIGVNSLYDLVHNASANSNNMLAQRVDALAMILSEYLPEIAEQKNVVLDNGALVGQLVPAMNRGLGLALS